jgi:hypothetical protein
LPCPTTCLCWSEALQRAIHGRHEQVVQCTVGSASCAMRERAGTVMPCLFLYTEPTYTYTYLSPRYIWLVVWALQDQAALFCFASNCPPVHRAAFLPACTPCLPCRTWCSHSVTDDSGLSFAKDGHGLLMSNSLFLTGVRLHNYVSQHAFSCFHGTSQQECCLLEGREGGICSRLA